MNTFKEGDQYRLFVDQYNYILLTVSYIESNVVWLSNSDSCYKYDRKTERLYKWVGDGYNRVDTEYGFSKLSSDDTAQALLESRKQQNSVDYIGFYRD